MLGQAIYICILMVNQIKTMCELLKTHDIMILITAVSSGTSCVLSFTMALTSFAAMQMFKQQLAGSEYMTIVGGLLGSTIFFFVLVVSFCVWCGHYSVITLYSAITTTATRSIKNYEDNVSVYNIFFIIIITYKLIYAPIF